jgi:hypothetical protein
MVDIRKPSKNELVELNKRVVDRLNEITNAEFINQTNAFNVADIVSFENNAEKLCGVILRINKKTISVAVSSQERFKISPSLLKIAKKPSQEALDLKFIFFPLKDPQRVLDELGIKITLKQSSHLLF